MWNEALATNVVRVAVHAEMVSKLMRKSSALSFIKIKLSAKFKKLLKHLSVNDQTKVNFSHYPRRCAFIIIIKRDWDSRDILIRAEILMQKDIEKKIEMHGNEWFSAVRVSAPASFQ